MMGKQDEKPNSLKRSISKRLKVSLTTKFLLFFTKSSQDSESQEEVEEEKTPLLQELQLMPPPSPSCLHPAITPPQVLPHPPLHGPQTACFAAGDPSMLEIAFRTVPGVLSAALCHPREAASLVEVDREVNISTSGCEEAVLVSFDPTIVTFASLCGVFWEKHDPTLKNQRVRDDGYKRRSAIFYFSESQRLTAQQSSVQRQISLSRRITTKILPATEVKVAGKSFTSRSKTLSYN